MINTVILCICVLNLAEKLVQTKIYNIFRRSYLESLIKEFIAIFNIEKAVYKQMLSLSKQKKDVIINDDIQALDSIVFNERLTFKKVKSLEIKREVIENLTYSGLHPYSRFYLSDVKKTFGEYWKNHFSTIGLIGMNDALLNFMNKSIGKKEGKQFAEKVLDYMRKRIADFQEETGNIFNLEATPAEGTTYRFAKEDKKRYGDSILQAGMDDNIYYTNSSQIPVDLTNDPFEALTLQDDLQCKYTGGTVLHLYMQEKVSSTEACRKLVKNVISNFRLPYITVTPLFSVCPKHGYISGEHEYCPKCDDELIHEQENLKLEIS